MQLTYPIQGVHVVKPYRNALLDIAANGAPVAPGGEPTREVIGLTYEGRADEVVQRPGINHNLGIVEGLNLIAGRTHLDALRRVAPKTTARFYDTNRKSWYAEPLAGGLADAIARLCADPDTRQAIAFIGSNGVAPEDMTCASSVQFLVRDGRLTTLANMRSWDLFLGLPYNTMMFGILAIAVGRHLGLPDVPQLRIHAASAHVYEKHIPHLDTIVEPSGKRLTMPPFPARSELIWRWTSNYAGVCLGNQGVRRLSDFVEVVND